MALHPEFPESPHEIALPEHRWFPADEQLRDLGYEKLLPPLVAQLRKKVREWRDSGYVGATETSVALLRWWFQTEHLVEGGDGESRYFRYYFAQREAVETVIYLYEVAQARDKYDLIRFDASGAVSHGMFDESWTRYVIKMATGSGKTKVLSLLLAWCFFHKSYEEDSTLARNFLVIAPNIIVLDRLRADFEGLRIFFNDPVLPNDGYEGQNWQSDFQLTLHVQDDLGFVRKTGNLFLTNIHRVYENRSSDPSFDDADTTDYFLGDRPVASTTDSTVDVGDIIREVDELVVLNDEAHHIHDSRLAWFKSIQDIHNQLKMKGAELSLQLDVTATPKHSNGAIFAQTVADYPLVEAIYQNVLKHPVLPDLASRGKLSEHKSVKFSERYKEYLHLGYVEWRKAAAIHEKLGKKAVLFVMTDDTKNCDEVAGYLRSTYPDFDAEDSILVIHTKRNGEISEARSSKAQEELKRLRRAANEIDDASSPYKAIVSVLMLKEGWDVRNVTTIVGLRAYTASSNILPEQTLGRGLRRMYSDNTVEELVSVVGTDAFMDFVESIKTEGVELERVRMGEGGEPQAPLLIEVDRENEKKDLEDLDIEIPVLAPRIYREYKNLAELDVAAFRNKKLPLKKFSAEEIREIIFRDITTGEVTHVTEFDPAFMPEYQNVLGYFARAIMRELRLVSGYDILYGKLKEFIANHLFTERVDLEDPNTLRNLSELEATRIVIETFRRKINELTVLDRGEAEIQNYIKLSQTRPFVVKDRSYVVPKKSVFNRVVGDSNFELEIAAFLDSCDDIVSFGKNYLAVHFRIDYQTAEGAIADYYPDFLVKLNDREHYVVETKGREDLDDVKKIKRLHQWCEDVNAEQSDKVFRMLYVKQETWNKLDPRPSSFEQLVNVFEDAGPEPEVQGELAV